MDGTNSSFNSPLGLVNTLHPLASVVIISALSLLSVNILVGILALIASFELLRRSGSPIEIPKFIPNLDFGSSGNADDEGSSKIAGNTGAPLPTLEENVVDNMLPRTASDAFDKAPFKPVQNSVHGAGKL